MQGKNPTWPYENADDPMVIGACRGEELHKRDVNNDSIAPGSKLAQQISVPRRYLSNRMD
ncbi:hypothetical protein AJ78_02256 [Emergomyces pasteurianus Ep9510]|uniref:Uncharacterized protein n=1 Tax=Emergomyces pasteurianus Ep9510 TaxID=1447872 RepID=A0A1J9PMK1_9EURO|nr:hypothetical protein AJ78_02256 [Emergomyces pasteurianus Ep9510]